MNKRVVITGMGIYSCIGTNLSEVQKSLTQGKSGIIYDPERKEYGFRSALTGVVPKPDLKSILNRKQRNTIGQETEFAYRATLDALHQANIVPEDFLKHEIGLIYGNDRVSKAIIDATDIVRSKKDTTLIGSGAIFKSMNSTITMNLSTLLNIRGINMTISAACASGSHALGSAYMMIKTGLQDKIICGGAQEINKYAMASFDGLGAFSTRELEPTKASRPFDSSRDGLIPSGGAATLVLESLESTKARGAHILAEIVGYGFSSSGGHISIPNIEAQTIAIQKALTQANMNASEIQYINAHATSTPIGDANEAQAINTTYFTKANPM